MAAPTSDSRIVTLTRLDAMTHKYLRVQAAMSGLSLSEFLRRLLVKAVEQASDHDRAQDLDNELERADAGGEDDEIDRLLRELDSAESNGRTGKPVEDQEVARLSQAAMDEVSGFGTRLREEGPSE